MVFKYRAFGLLLSLCFFVTPILIASIASPVNADDNEPVVLLDDVLVAEKSPVQDHFVVLDTDGNLYIWDFASGQPVVMLEGGPFDTTLNCLEWSEDGLHILGGFNDIGRVWDARTGQLLSTFGDHPVSPVEGVDFDYAGGISDLVISPDGLFIATANLYDSSIILWDAQTYEIATTLSGHESAGYSVGIRQLEFSADGKYLAALKAVGGVALWDVLTGEHLDDLPGNVMSFSHDSTILATGEGRLTSHIWIWDVATRLELNTFESPLAITAMNWAQDDSVLFGNFTDFALVSDGFEYVGMAVRGWRADQGWAATTFNHPTEKSLYIDLAVHEEVIGVGTAHVDDLIMIWNHERGETYNREYELTVNEGSPVMVTPRIFDFVLKPDTTLLATSTCREIGIWDFSTGDLLATLPIDSAALSMEWLRSSSGLVFLTQNAELLYVEW